MLCLERLRERAPRPHLLIDVLERRLEERVRHALAQDVQRLHDRQTGFEEGRQLLIEDDEFGAGDFPAPREVQLKPADTEPALSLNGQQEQALLFELEAQTGLAL